MKKFFSTLLMAITLSTIVSLPANAEWNEQHFKRVVQSLDDFWGAVSAELDRPYQSPTVHTHLDEDSTTPCGPLVSAHYCTRSNTVHLDMQFMDVLTDGIGDSTIYAILAHEYSHSVQQQLRLLPADATTLDEELQADCLAGTYFAIAQLEGLLDPSDIEDGFFSAFVIGDYGVDEPDHHGTPLQRAVAFGNGVSDPVNCFERLGPNPSYANKD